MKGSHYPSYDVMTQAPHWDEHTAQIVKKRLEPPDTYQSFSSEEVKNLQSIVSTLVDDTRTEILAYILSHIDNRLQSSKGEATRKIGVPTEKELVFNGIHETVKASRQRHGTEFYNLPIVQRQTILGQLEKEALGKLVALSVEAYYSHPVVWSEIGYGGPAYPRGYVRTEPGVLDPWEAQPEEEQT